MTWDYWITLYIDTHCGARGLSLKTRVAYRATLEQFRLYQRVHLQQTSPTEASTKNVLEYLEYLRRERHNGDSAVNRQATVLKCFYRAMVAMGQLAANENPLAHLPPIKPAAHKLPVVLSPAETDQLLDAPGDDTVLGLRDRAMLALLYGTGIRASECATLLEKNVDLVTREIRVTGKGGRERIVPLNSELLVVLGNYRLARGAVDGHRTFFLSRKGKSMSRGAVYERVRKWSQKAKLAKHVSPHTLRHTFATHLLRQNVNLVVIRDLLGHRNITSTQRYLSVTVQDLRAAAEVHPIKDLTSTVAALLPDVKLPFQRSPQRSRTG